MSLNMTNKKVSDTLKKFANPRLLLPGGRADMQAFDALSHKLGNLHRNDEVATELEELPSQTSLNERMGLYQLCATHYRGDGEIWDVGTAAGGSTYCMARGLKDNASVAHRAIKGFDLFGGYSLEAFVKHPVIKEYVKKSRGAANDLDLFRHLNRDFSEFVDPVQLDLSVDFAPYSKTDSVEVVHLDSAKSLDLWQATFPVIAESLLPEGSWLILQDFERCRLPWHWMVTADLLRNGIAEIHSVYEGGTVHLRLREKIPADIVDQNVAFDYTEDQIAENVALVCDWFVARPHFLAHFNGEFTDVVWGVLAYALKFRGDETLSKLCARNLTKDFLRKNKIYAMEL